jgi:hypothetical protein
MTKRAASDPARMVEQLAAHVDLDKLARAVDSAQEGSAP